MKIKLILLSILTLTSVSSFALPLRYQKLVHKTSFAADWFRYPSPDAILNKFRHEFPDQVFARVSVTCTMLDVDNRTLLGDSDPTTGRPAVDQPNGSFVNWYMNCLSEFIKTEESSRRSLARSDSQSVQRDFGAVSFFGSMIAHECGTNVSACIWSRISPEAQRDLIKRYVHKFIGPESILIDENVSDSETDFVEMIEDEINRFNENPDSQYDFLLSSIPYKGYLMVSDAAMIAKFLIGIQDTLRY